MTGMRPMHPHPRPGGQGQGQGQDGRPAAQHSGAPNPAESAYGSPLGHSATMANDGQQSAAEKPAGGKQGKQVASAAQTVKADAADYGQAASDKAGAGVQVMLCVCLVDCSPAPLLIASQSAVQRGLGLPPMPPMPPMPALRLAAGCERRC